MSFAAAAFLAGLAALALPWWLHRLASRSAETRPVSSLLLMRPGEAPRQRRRQLRYRGLLVLRLLLLAALALAFAQPLLERPPAPSAATARPLVVVLDTSPSMAAHVEAARDTALGLLDGLPPGGRGAVLAAAAELRLLTGLTADRGRLRDAVAAAEPGATRLGFDGLLGRVTALAATLTDAPVAVHVISDFQASAMPPQFNALVAGAGGSVTLHALTDTGDNWQLAGIRIDDRVHASVRSHAAVPRRLTVTLSAGSGELGRQQVQVAAGGSATVSFPLTAAAAGDVWLRAALDGADGVPADDVAYRIVAHAEPLALPVFAGVDAAGQRAYLEAAVGAAAPRFSPAAAEASGPVAVLLDPGVLSGRDARLLDRHLADGGALLLIGGPATRRAGVLPVTGTRLGAGVFEASDRQPRAVIGIDPGHPAIGNPGTAGPAWRDVQVFRRVAVEPGAEAAVLLALDDGTPLLLEQRLAAGRMLVLTTALDPAWSSLVTRPEFVAFIGAALAYLADDHLPIAALAGEPIALPSAGVQLFDAGGRRLLSLGDTVARASVRLAEPGIYTLRTPNRQRLLAVNVDPRESEPQPADPALLSRWRDAVAWPAQAAAGTAPAATPAAAPAAAASGVVALAPWLLGLLLLLALMEPVIANGRRGAPA